MCECATATGAGVGFRFWQDDVNLGVRFDGGQITSDGGLPWVVQAEMALGVCAALAGGVPEWRRGGVRHSLVRLVRQRVFQIACGYADGYPRHAPSGTPVLVNGQRTRTVGRVSMDMIAVDISDIPDAYIGSPVTLWGDGLSADEVGTAAGTLSYELLTKVTQRVQMVEVP